MSELKWVSLRSCVPPHTSMTVFGVFIQPSEVISFSQCPFRWGKTEEATALPAAPATRRASGWSLQHWRKAAIKCLEEAPCTGSIGSTIPAGDLGERRGDIFEDHFQNGRLPIGTSFQNFIFAPVVGPDRTPTVTVVRPDLTELGTKEQKRGLRAFCSHHS